MQEKSVHLYFTEGSSDKVYQAHLRSRDGGWVVDYANGPRGKALRTGTKTVTPVPYEVALVEYERLVASKKKGGYTEDVSGAVYTSSEFAGRASGISPQLSTSIDDDDLDTMLADDLWVTQEKANGERRPLIFKDGQLLGTNRDGLFVDIPDHWGQQIGGLPAAVTFDGEHVGDIYYVFDVLDLNGEDLRPKTLEERLTHLQRIVSAGLPGFMRLLEPNFGEESKRAHLQWVTETKREGVVFKRLDAAYDAGRSEVSKKYKLVDSSTCIVLAHNQQRSVQIGMTDGVDGPVIPVGNVTIPANKDIPAVGSLVEVEYLYYNPGGSLEQPVYLQQRTDVTRESAVTAQIRRVKPTSEALVATERPRP